MNKLAILEKVAKGELTVDAATALLHPAKGEDFAGIYKEAHEAGMAAGNAATPTPMVVQQHANPLDDASTVTQQWAVPDGVCGFAMISFAGNTKWGRWAKTNTKAHPAYGGGLSIWVPYFGQSMERKSAYASAFSAVLNKHSIKATSSCRMD